MLRYAVLRTTKPLGFFGVFNVIFASQVWIQVACPRLSIDWGASDFHAPLLSPYEAMVLLEATPWMEEYPMDYYSNEKKPWSNYF